jgi:DNA-binding NtrC family response regulator
MIQEGRFREDLYYRLNVMTVEVPPLRDRLGDLPELASHLITEAATQFGVDVQAISPLALQKLLSYRWPGNIRELRNKLQQAVAAAHGPMLGAEDLPVPTPSAETRTSAPPLPDEIAGSDGLLPLVPARQALVDRFERSYLRRLLTQTGGNVTRAAAIAGIPRKALGRLIAKHDLGSYASGKRGRPRRQDEENKAGKEDRA